MTNHRFTFEVLDKKPLGDFDDILQDGQIRSHRMIFADSADSKMQIALDATEAVKTQDRRLLALNRRPGFHYADSTVDSQAEARAANRQATYDAYDEQLRTAYLGKRKEPEPETFTVPLSTLLASGDTATRPTFDATAAKARKDAAYAAYDSQISDAWRNK
jgi:hypothetical protein